MKIVSWNINGIRASKTDLKQLFDSLDADVICLQETKITRVANFCKDCATPVNAEEGLSGLLTTKQENSIGCYGDQSSFTSDELQALDAEGRAVLTKHQIRLGNGTLKDLVIINVYCPRADPEREDRLLYKLRFYALLQTRAEELLKNGYHVVVLGDINTVHKKLDSADTDQPEEVVRRPSRVWLNQFLLEVQRDATIDDLDRDDFAGVTPHTIGGLFVDTYRYLHPDQPDAFTNWCTLTAARATNYGRRLDYIFADVELVEDGVQDGTILASVEGSDHCPVKTEFTCSCVGAPTCPPLCTKFMPEFSGKQQKLSMFFTKTHSREHLDSGRLKVSTPTGGGCLLNDPSQLMTLGGKRMLENSAGDNSSISQKSKRTKTDAAKKPNVGPKQSSLVNFFSKKNQRADSKQNEISRICSDGDKSDKIKRAGSGPELGTPQGLDKDLQIDSSVSNVTVAESQAPTTKTESFLPGSDSKQNESAVTLKDASSSTAASAWKNLLKGLGPVPMCKGHSEPCVLRMVKKPGPNKGKQFYVCARGEGLKSNPEARCDFFQWVNSKKK